jgi:hypothetical protein
VERQRIGPSVAADIGEEQGVAGLPPEGEAGAGKFGFAAFEPVVQVDEESPHALAAPGDVGAGSRQGRVEEVVVGREFLANGVMHQLRDLEYRLRKARRGGDAGTQKLGDDVHLEQPKLQGAVASARVDPAAAAGLVPDHRRTQLRCKPGNHGAAFFRAREAPEGAQPRRLRQRLAGRNVEQGGKIDLRAQGFRIALALGATREQPQLREGRSGAQCGGAGKDVEGAAPVLAAARAYRLQGRDRRRRFGMPLSGRGLESCDPALEKVASTGIGKLREGGAIIVFGGVLHHASMPRGEVRAN